MKAEHNKLQARCFQWFWNTYPNERYRMWMNYNNPHNAREGATLKAMGLVAGVADLAWITPSGRFIGIEFKVGADKQSEAQKSYQKAIESAGGIYVVVTSFEEFLTTIYKHLG
jgi:hypothetical protein